MRIYRIARRLKSGYNYHMAPKNGKSNKLPGSFKPYFWDVKFNKISLRKYPEFILGRILDFGDIRAVRWILQRVKTRDIKRYLLKSGDRQLYRQSNNFWRTIFGLPVSTKPVNPIWPH